jgi:glycosyltransferase involved in cell wall biosynthesis
MVFVQFAIAAMSVNIWSVRSLCKRCAAAKIPVVVAYHEPAREYGLFGVVTRSIYHAMARVTEVPVAFSPAGRQALTESGLFDNVIEVALGTTGVTAIPDSDVQRVRNLYNVRKPLVLSLGFTGADKGTDVLLDAANAIAERRNGDVQFLIAGSPRKRRGIFRLRGHLERRLQRQLELRGRSMTDNDIAFGGFVADRDVAALLFVADVVALPYRAIAQSAVANMALSSRAVIVASNLPGLRSDLGGAARYVAVGDSGALAEEIARLLGADNASAREHMRELSGERAAANTFARVAETILVAGLAKEMSA